MNRQRYQLVFNRHRAQLMAVPEHASAVGGAIRPAAGTVTGGQGSMWRVSVLSVVLTLTWQGLAQAQIFTDRNAPRQQRPTVLVAPNGVPLINIQQPNRAGLSLNSYRQFDVGPQGVILNNAAATAKSQLGGHVAGNPWLARGGAGVIVNQVNSSAPSYLRGFIEVAGAGAQVVIANPNGITCSGCGFINAHRASLTTGSPVIEGGNLEAYRVAGGTLTIDGDGLDATRTSYTDLIARALQVNAGVWAQQLQVSTGLNTVRADHGSVVPGVAAAGPAPVRAIDVAQLGGMYAGHIFLMATERGVGVSNAGRLAASVGQLVVTAEGQLENSGSLLARADARLTVAGALSNSGTVESNASVRIGAAALDNSARVNASEAMVVRLAGILRNSGTMGSDTALDLQAGALENREGGRIETGGRLSLGSLGNIRNQGRLGGDAGMEVRAATLENHGMLTTPGALHLMAQGTVLNTGTIGANGPLRLQAATLDNRKALFSDKATLTITLTGQASNSGKLEAAGNMTITAASLENAGKMVNDAALSVHTVGTIRNTGTLGAHAQVHITAASLDNQGKLGAGETLRISASGEVRNTQVMSGRGEVRLDAASFTNSGKLLTPQALRIAVRKSIDNTGEIGANEAVTLEAAALENDKTLYSAKSSVLLKTTGLSRNSGVIEAANNIALDASEVINSGRIAATEALTVAVSKAVGNTGDMGANADMQLSAASLVNRGKIRSAKGAVNLKLQEGLDNHGDIHAQQALQLNARGIDNSDGLLVGGNVVAETPGQRLDNRRGRILARQDIRIASAALDNSAGEIFSRGKITIDGAALDNERGLIQAQGALRIDTDGQVLRNTSSGTTQGLRAGKSLTIKAGGLINRNGILGAAEEVALDVASLDNQGGDIGSNTGLKVNAHSLDNRAGRLQAGRDLVLDISTGVVENMRGLIRAEEEVSVQAGRLRNDETQGRDQGIEGRTLRIAAQEVSNQAGALRADQSLVIDAGTRVDNRSGLISSVGKLSIRDVQDGRKLVIDNDDGRVISGQQLEMRAKSLSGKGNVLSHGGLSVDLVDDFHHTGNIAANGNATIRTVGQFSNSGAAVAGAGLEVTAKGIDNRAGGSLLGDTVKLLASNDGRLINRGLVDGRYTELRGGTLDNLGSGRIYGDRVSIDVGVLNNRAETVDGKRLAAAIAARERMEIRADVVNNEQHALLYSAGDLRIDTAREVNNNSATINADGKLTIAAATINNINTQLETTEQAQPGRRIIQYRPNGYPNLVDGNSAHLVNMGSGQVVGPNNWRDMGDEDNFRLVLPSAAYPVERYGPPFSYSRGRRATDVAVAPAYEPARSYGRPETGVTHVPEILNYAPGDAIWGVMGITPPAQAPGPAPIAPGSSEMCYESCVTSYPDPAAVERYKAEFAIWKPKYDAYKSALLQLDARISAFNDDVRRRSYREWTIYDGTEQITRTIVTRSDPGMITSGGDMHLIAAQVNNTASQIIAGGVVAGDSVNGTAINNNGPLGTQTVTTAGSASYTYIKSHRFRADDRRYDDRPYESQTIVTRFPLDITPTNDTGSSRVQTARASGTPVGPVQSAVSSTSPRSVPVDLTLPDNVLYQINNSTNTQPLVQTDPRFIGARNRISSDFLLNQWRSLPGPTASYKRLGDGFYEQQLIQRQIQHATGQRYLSGYSNTEAQYLALMKAGLLQAQDQRYTVGIALSAEQLAQLKTDIVWLVSKNIMLADGSRQEVLVPQVYLRPASLQVTGEGTLIAGNEVALQAAQDIINRGGTIAARQGVSLRAGALRNLGGRIAGDNLNLSASQDIDNQGGRIDGNNGVSLQAGRDIRIDSTSVQTRNATTSGSNIDQFASVTGRDVRMVAGRDVQANAAVIAASGSASVVAGRDVSLGSVNENFRQEIRWGDDKGGSNWVGKLTGPNLVDRANGAHGTTEAGVNRAVVTGSKGVATQISGKDIRISAGQDLLTKGTQIVADTSLQASAGRDIQIGTANESASARDQHQRSSSGILNATTIRTDDAGSYSRQMGSTFSGNTVALRAGNDVNVIGSNVVSTQGTSLVAGHNVNVAAATDSSTQRNFRQETTSGVMGAGLGVTVGSRMQSRDVDGNSQTASASTIGSVQGDVRIVAGNRYMQVGSDVLAPAGDIDIAARSVDIRAAQQTSKRVTEDRFRQQGVTAAVTSPVLSAVQSIEQMVEAASKTKDGRMQALAAANAGFAGKQAFDAIKAGQGTTLNGRPNQIATGPADAKGNVPSRNANAAEKVGGINLAFSVGASSSASHTEQSGKTVRGSTVDAGGNLNITAQGGGADSNILIQGSDIKAGINATLHAANEIRLLADQNISRQHSSNRSSSGSVGVSIGTDGLMFNASASGSRGRGDGSDVEQVNTHVDAGNKAKLSSGTDTTLRGAVVAGKRVEIETGASGHGDLNIASLQDTSTYKSRQQGVGGSVSVGMGRMNGSVNANRSRVDGEFASVGEQSGIRAGDEGFQIDVAGNTDLKGAKIASTDKAAVEGRNRLSTETLTQTDIQNRSSYKAESISAGIGLDGVKGALTGTGIGIGIAGGSESSTTRSGISQADIRITDDAAQQGKTGKSVAQTIGSINADVSSDRDTSGKLSKQWDAQALQADVQAQAQITQAFGQQAARLIGDYADEQQKQAVNLRAQAEVAADPDVAKRLDDQASAIERKWGADGTMRVLAHTVVGGLTGGISGAAGTAVGTLTAPAVGSALKDAGVDAGLAKVLIGLSSTLVGAAVGGTAGGAAAYNEVTNNYLRHAEDEQRLKKKAACTTSQDPSVCRGEVEKSYMQIARAHQQRTCSDADSCRQNKREIEDDLQTTTARQSVLDRKLYQEKLTEAEKDEYFSNGQQIQLMQAALQDADRQFRARVPISQWTLQERDAALADALTALGGVGQAVVIGSGKAVQGTKGRPASEEAPPSSVKQTDIAEEIAALKRMASNPGGADLSKKAPNAVLNQKAVQDLFDGSLPGTPINPKRPWTPRQMPESPNPSATAEDFALRVLGRNPTSEELARGSRMNKGNCQGCWHAENVDGVTVTYRPAGEASNETLPSTATVELNGPDTINKLNLDKNGKASEIKLKFPLR